MTDWWTRNTQWLHRRLVTDFKENGLGVRKRNLDFLDDPAFVRAYNFAVEGYRKSGAEVPNIRWRAHICCWAATHGSRLDGDFVECGVNTGMTSQTVCHFLDFDRLGKKFFLFDTFSGIPLASTMTADERRYAERMNQTTYRDVWEVAKSNFAPFKAATLVRGILPGTLAEVPLDKIAYLSVDLNNAEPERQVIETLWPKLSTGAVVVIDDYGFAGHEAQYAMWNGFAARHGTMVATLPTGQGLLLKP